MSAQPIEIYRDGEAACFLVDDLVVYRDIGLEPAKADGWAAYIRCLKRVLPQIARCLVIPRVAGLTPRQREELRALIGRRQTAVLTASMVNRCIITSLSWFKLPISAFAPGRYQDALRWLDREALLPAVLRGLERFPPLTEHNRQRIDTRVATDFTRP